MHGSAPCVSSLNSAVRFLTAFFLRRRPPRGRPSRPCPLRCATLDADALGDEGLQDEAAIRAAYEGTVAEERAAAAGEDFSDMVADHARAQKRKAKDKKGSDAKKFKF